MIVTFYRLLYIRESGNATDFYSVINDFAVIKVRRIKF